ncbi:hypothetical protein A3709_19480 [Halioglobus sp. HI00S01]|uniref:hypothetical protein n=1 Tax=Halioglobus sp. HI00S01 TaxID=1822214 RepID=UPI0007C31BCF|nr:hypothetical protein [Halioglobus sp. HI00S01]KZX57807.1 hypothetical protein A3709_19480 [Halioglobus sp. HI00S01]
MSQVIGEFPFDEIRMGANPGETSINDGDYFESAEAAMEATGLGENHIWSVTDNEDDDGNSVFCYGPSRHFVNLIGFIATKEPHDGETYYEDVIELND